MAEVMAELQCNPETEEDSVYVVDNARPKSCVGKDKPAYRYPNHNSDAFATLNLLRKQSLLCDVTLVIDATEVPCHKVVLASSSQYFYAMFTGEMAEAKADRIVLQEVDSNALELLIDFVYTAEIHITDDNVQILLPAANLLQLTEVQEACEDYLQSQLHPSNCLGIRDFADHHACANLLACSQTYTEQHFSEVVHYDEFLSLPAPQVCKLVSSDYITVTSEEYVFEAVLSWLRHDLTTRHHHMSTLIEHVRLPLMPLDYLVSHVEVEPLVKESSHCKDFLIEALKFHLLKPEQKVSLNSPRTVPRTPIGLPKVMVVIGGQAPKAIRSVERHDFKEEKWSQLSEMPSRRCRCGVAVVNGLVYAAGGFNGSLRVRTVDVYDPVKDIWTSAPSMEARRSTLGVAVLNGLIYAVGGFDGSSGLDSAECFDPKLTIWKAIASMNTRRSSVGVGVVGGLLYAVGGYDGASRQCLGTVECYNAATDSWTNVSEMSCRRSGAGVGVIDNILYAVGGHDGPLVRKSVESYNAELGRWQAVADMHMCRRNAGVVTNAGVLYVVGGDDGSSNLVSVESYDPKTNQWTLMPCSMTTGRSYAGVAAIDKPV